MHSSRKPLIGQSGYSILEVLIALGILGISFSAMVNLLTNTERSDKIETIKATQRMLADKIALVITNPQSLANSLRKPGTGNAALRNCVIDGNICAHIGQNLARGFYLADPQDSLGGSMPALAGPPTQTVRYNTKGQLCNTGPSCVFRAQVEFWGVCDLDRSLPIPSPLPTCAQPIDLMFRYKVTAHYPGANLSDYPPTTTDPFSGVFLIRRSDLATVANQRCAPYQRQVGVDTKGNIICECIVKETDSSGNIQYESNGQPRCGRQRCPSTGSLQQVMVGFDANGNIKCINQNICAAAHQAIANGTATGADYTTAQLCPCEQIVISDPNRSQCSPGYWMVNLTWGQCWAVTDKSKANPEVVKCDNNIGVCCKIDAD